MLALSSAFGVWSSDAEEAAPAAVQEPRAPAPRRAPPQRAVSRVPLPPPGTRPLLRVAAGDPRLVGRSVRARSVRVVAVVAPTVFAVAAGRTERVLVRFEGPGTRWQVRAGQKVTFVGRVAETPPGAARAWGAGDGAATHLVVYGPSIRFARVCAGQRLIRRTICGAPRGRG